MRILVEAAGGGADADLVQEIFGTLAGLLLIALAVAEVDLLHLIADRVDRVERRHRVLEDHRCAVAARRCAPRAPVHRQPGPLEPGAARRKPRAPEPGAVSAAP